MVQTIEKGAFLREKHSFSLFEQFIQGMMPKGIEQKELHQQWQRKQEEHEWLRPYERPQRLRAERAE
jgi:ribosomal protein L13